MHPVKSRFAWIHHSKIEINILVRETATTPLKTVMIKQKADPQDEDRLKL